MYRRLTTIAGRTIITRCTDSSRIGTDSRRRAPKTRPTPAAVAKVNKMNQERSLTALLNHNFVPGDMWVVLAYPEDVTIEEASKRVEKFKRSLRTHCRKNGIQYKLVESMGIGERNGKIHHHIVMNSEITRKAILAFWPEEYVHVNYLWADGNYRRVAKYMLKNAYQAKDRRGKHKKAWRASRSVTMPETRVEQMKRQATYDIEDLKPRKGYQIDRDSIRMYEHPITGACCIEYIEVSLTEEPRLQKYYKGKKAKSEPYYPVDEQIDIEDLIAAFDPEQQGWI